MQEINQFVLYSTENGNVKLEIFLEEETLWLSQKMMAELFEVEVNTINYHIKEIFKSTNKEHKDKAENDDEDGPKDCPGQIATADMFCRIA